jgi:uncharacterized tellurite resistance protein B-like protein
MECGTLVFLIIVAIAIVWAVAAATKSEAGARTSRSARHPSAASRSIASSGYSPRVREEFRANPEQCWIGVGGSTEVAGYSLDGGMVYVGSNLAGVRRDWYEQVEPALINPKLPVARSNPDRTGSSMTYWPSYHTISSEARAGYLEWLASGRRDPAAPIGFVFLFFYGIERRVLADAEESTSARAEIHALLQEVEALLSVYGNNSSFSGYASSFLEVGRLLHRSVLLSELEPSYDHVGWSVPLTTKIALGAYADQGEAVPVSWALSWILSSSSFRLRTPAHRCSEEFRRLFELRYPGHFRGGGLKIKPNKTRLSAHYQAASRSFGHGQVKLTLPDLPDVTIVSGPVRKLQELVDRVTDELDPYSRWIGRNDDRHSPPALALLPLELAAERSSPESDRIERSIRKLLDGQDWAAVGVGELVSAWPSKASDKFTKRESEMLARFLEARGTGIEPDPRFGGPSLSQAKTAILFRLDEAATGTGQDVGEPSLNYQAATLLLHLAAAVAAADGEIAQHEERHLEEHLEVVLKLSAPERHRLRQHLRWLLAEPPGISGLKRRIEIFDREQRRSLGRFLVTVAGADGRVDPQELKILRKVYPLLGLDSEAVFSDVHALMAGGGMDDEPITVLKGKPSEGFAIPTGEVGDLEQRGGLTLDTEKIRATRQATARVASLLAEVFEDEEEPFAAAPPEEPEDGPTLCGLDSAHSTFLLELSARTTWERIEIEHLAGELGLLPDGALELINDAAFEICGSPLLEGDDLVEIDRETLQEMVP